MIKKESPTQRINVQIQTEFNQAKHRVKLLSLENSYNADDLQNWDAFLQRQLAKVEIEDYTFEIEPKFD
jgi:DNA ligase (NAD+)